MSINPIPSLAAVLALKRSKEAAKKRKTYITSKPWRKMPDMHTLKNITTTLIITLLLSFTGFASATMDVNLKTASGVENLAAGGYQQKTVFNSLFHQGKIDFSYDDVSGSPVATKKGLTTPNKYFGSKTYKEAEKSLTDKFGPPRGGGKYNKSFFNEKTGRTYNLHKDPSHRGGKGHIDIRKRDLPTNYYKDRPFFLKEGG